MPRYFRTLGMFLLLLSPLSVQAEEPTPFFNHLAAIVSASYDLGTFRNPNAGLQSRMVDILSLEAFPGYRVGKLLFGIDFDYRFEGQFSSLETANGTNVKGQGWLLGLGANYTYHSRFCFEVAFDFLGSYQFSNQTTFVSNDHLSGPLNLRLKGQYFFTQELPLSIDADLQFLMYRTLTIADVDYHQASYSFLIGVGMSYHFQVSQKATP